MTIQDARTIEEQYVQLQGKPSDEEFFLYTEAMLFLIAEQNDPEDMMRLGGEYYDRRDFDLALKYYEMAAALDYDPAYEGLGYIWYYGRTGVRDYAKAFEYFSRLKDKGDLTAAYKIADMYKNGYHVQKDMSMYAQIIEDLYPKVRHARQLFAPVPEIFTRLAGIRRDQGRTEDAADLYLRAKDHLAQRIRYSAFWGDLNIMKWLIDDLYKLQRFDWDDFDFYDLYYVLKGPDKVQFYYEDKVYTVESVQEDGFVSVLFNGKWFRDRDDFFRNAQIGESKLTALYEDIYGLVDMVTRSVTVTLESPADDRRFRELFPEAIRLTRDKMYDHVICVFGYAHPGKVEFIQCANDTDSYLVETAVLGDGEYSYVNDNGLPFQIYRHYVPDAEAASAIFRQVIVDGRCPDLAADWENITKKLKTGEIK